MSMMKIFIAVAFMACLALTQAEVGYQSPEWNWDQRTGDGEEGILNRELRSEFYMRISANSADPNNWDCYVHNFTMSGVNSTEAFEEEFNTVDQDGYVYLPRVINVGDTAGNQSIFYRCEDYEFPQDDPRFVEIKFVVSTECIPGATLASGDCEWCGKGTAQPDENSSDECTECQPGQYAQGLGNAECGTCPPNFFSEEAGSSGCTRCRADKVSDAGASTCTLRETDSPFPVFAFIGGVVGISLVLVGAGALISLRPKDGFKFIGQQSSTKGSSSKNAESKPNKEESSAPSAPAPPTPRAPKVPGK